MEPAHWERLQEIYHQAVALPSSERDAFLEDACAGDLGFFRELKALLKAAYSRGGILDSPVIELGSASDSLVGTTIGDHYLIESELTHGGMSQVYLAGNLRLPPQKVVIKVLSPTLVENPYAQQKFDQEVKALLRMEHPGVVRVQDRGDLADGRPYIVMPYIDGVPLSSQIPRAGMDLERAAAIVKQIGAALDHAHENGVFHRDLKPDNIMLRRDTDSVVLIDFGLAKLRGSLIAPSTVSVIAGTVPYMSPEQLRGQTLTRASDVYSMGIVAYEMVTGRLPFDPASSSQMLEMQRSGVRVRPKQLRQSLLVEADRAIIRALKFEPSARYQTAGEFGDKLSAALVGKVGPPIPWAKIIAGLIIIAVVSFGVYEYIESKRNIPPGPNVVSQISTPTPTPTPPPSGTSRKFTYFLTIQKMRGGKKYQTPYKSNGKDDVFDRGDKFQLNISAPESGYLYLFNEGPPEADDTSFTMVYPNNKTTNGSASLGADQQAQSNWMTFRGVEGYEDVWIVWSIMPVSELEQAKTEAFKHPRGGLVGQNLISVKGFLQMKKQESDVEVRHYKAGPRAIGNGHGDLLIALAQLKHH